MASIAHFQDVLQKQWFQKIKFIGEYLRQEDLTESAAAADYHWRDRLWPPMLMLWAFLVQVLHPGWSSAAAVAEVLAEHAAAVLDVAIGAYRRNELSLWRQLWDQLQAGDVVPGDRFIGAYGELAQLVARGPGARPPVAPAQLCPDGAAVRGHRPLPVPVPRRGPRYGTVLVAARLDRGGCCAGPTSPRGTPCGPTKTQAP